MDAQNLDEFVILLRPKSSVNRAKARSCIRQRLKKSSPNQSSRHFVSQHKHTSRASLSGDQRQSEIEETDSSQVEATKYQRRKSSFMRFVQKTVPCLANILSDVSAKQSDEPTFAEEPEVQQITASEQHERRQRKLQNMLATPLAQRFEASLKERSTSRKIRRTATQIEEPLRDTNGLLQYAVRPNYNEQVRQSRQQRKIKHTRFFDKLLSQRILLPVRGERAQPRDLSADYTETRQQNQSFKSSKFIQPSEKMMTGRMSSNSGLAKFLPSSNSAKASQRLQASRTSRPLLPQNLPQQSGRTGEHTAFAAVSEQQLLSDQRLPLPSSSSRKTHVTGQAAIQPHICSSSQHKVSRASSHNYTDYLQQVRSPHRKKDKLMFEMDSLSEQQRQTTFLQIQDLQHEILQTEELMCDQFQF